MFHFSIEIYARIFVSLIIGLILGYEREKKSKPAGIKTIPLVCLAATILMIISIKGGTIKDPMRLAAQVVNGIGFIGAGVIWKSPSGLKGITTAADIWIANALGLTIGLGYYDITIISLICIFLVLNIGKLFGFKSQDDIIDSDKNEDSEKKSGN